jgi:hypothetical protein
MPGFFVMGDATSQKPVGLAGDLKEIVALLDKDEGV